jgi:hypothetical protein
MGDVQRRLDVAEASILPAAWIQKVRSGLYVNQGIGGLQQFMTPNRLCLSPVIIPSQVTFIEAAISVITTGPGSAYRCGLYSDDGNGAPQNLLYAFPSTFDTSLGGIQIQAINVTVPAGLFWVGGSMQGGTSPGFTNMGPFPSTIIVSQSIMAANNARAYYMDGVSGALPSNFTFVVANTDPFNALMTLKVQ